MERAEKCEMNSAIEMVNRFSNDCLQPMQRIGLFSELDAKSFGDFVSLRENHVVF